VDVRGAGCVVGHRSQAGRIAATHLADVDFERKTVVVMLAKDTRGRATKRRIVHLPTPAIDALKKLRRDGIIGRKLVFVDGIGDRLLAFQGFQSHFPLEGR
jgi:integrase